jgi:tetratricopeptide (TPR) repeat protein
MRRRARAALASTLCLVVACAGESPPEQNSAATAKSSASLPTVSLPDLSGMDASVQAQLRQQSEARAYGEVGRLLMAAEYFEAAEPYLLHAQAQAPEDVRWPYYLGHVHMANADPVKAGAAFQRALQLQPDDVATLVWLGNLYLDQGQPELAEPLFARAVSKQPRLVAGLFGLGRTALARRDFSRAADYLEQALAADARATVVHYPLALAYRGLGDAAKAEAHLRQRGSVEVGPPDPLMVELRGLLQGPVAEETRGVRALDAGDFSTAAGHFRKAVELSPGSAALRHKLGTALSLAGDVSGAVREFEEALRREPGFAQAHYSLGVLLASNGNVPQATEHIAAAVKSQPDYVDARLRLAELLRQGGQIERSLAQYREVLAIDPRVSDARFGYGATLAAMGRLQDARDAFSEAARLHPDQPRFTEALARVDSALAGR